MILKSSETARARVDEALKDAAKSREETAKALTALNEKNAAEESAMNEALTSGNIEGYQQHKAALDAVKDIKAAHEKRAEILEHKELITEAEYNEMVSAIMDEARKECEKAEKLIVSHINNAIKVGAQLCEAYDDAEKVLRILQNDVYRNADRPHDNNGNPKGWVGAKEIPRECWDIVKWIVSITDNPTYRYCAGIGEREEINIMDYIK